MKSNGNSKTYFEFRAAPNGIDQYNRFMTDNFVAIGWPKIGDVSQIKPDSKNSQRQIIKQRLSANYPKDFKDKSIYLTQVTTFFIRLLNMREGDILLIPNLDKKDPKVTIATVSEPYHYNDTDTFMAINSTHQIGISGISEKKHEVQLSDLSTSLRNRLRAQLTITLISEDKYSEINRLLTQKNFSSKRDITKDAVITNIKTLKTLFQQNDDVLIRKSILLSTFSLVEGYLSEILKKKYSETEKITVTTSNQTLIKYGKHYISDLAKKLNNLGFNKKIKLFTELYKIAIAPEVPASINTMNSELTVIRNSLAHDITIAALDLESNTISVEDQSYDTDKFFLTCISFAENITI